MSRWLWKRYLLRLNLIAFDRAKLKRSFSSYFSPASRQSVMVVKDPFRYFWIRILVLCFIVASMVACFYIGEYWSSEAAFERDALVEDKQALIDSLAQRDQQVAVLKVDKKLSSIAVENVRQNNIVLQNKVSELEKDLLYYQRLMSPISNDKGLRIDTFDIASTSDSNRFRFSAVLTQLGQKNRSVIKGKVKLSVIGSQSGQKQIYSLEQLKFKDADLLLKFRFRYYQEIDGEFELPEGFVAEQVELVASSLGKKRMKMTKTIAWPKVESASL